MTFGNRGPSTVKGKKQRIARAQRHLEWPPHPQGSHRADEPTAEAEQKLFIEALEGLGSVPDKDLPQATGGPLAAPKRRPVPRKALFEPQDTLDLHSMSLEQARTALHGFVRRAAEEGLRTVLVITGKGHSSPSGVSVLKGELESWLMAKGRAYVHSYSEAPRALGGGGAYLLYLRS